MKNNLQRLSLDDLTFEHRNKLYGAYALRKQYPRHVTYGILVILSLFLFSLLLPDYLSKYSTKPEPLEVEPTCELIVYLPPPPEFVQPIQPKPVAPVQPKSETKPVSTLPTKIAATDDVPDLVIDMNTVDVKPLTDGSNSGTVSAVGDVPASGAETGTGTAPVYAEPKIENYAEVLPQFPGGDAALARQISKLLKYPKEAVAAGIEGVVYISFVVDPKGNVSRMKVEKGIGGGCDQEAMRVISLLSGWSPAIQNGNPVFFKYIMPVRFVIRKE